MKDAFRYLVRPPEVIPLPAMVNAGHSLSLLNVETGLRDA